MVFVAELKGWAVAGRGSGREVLVGALVFPATDGGLLGLRGLGQALVGETAAQAPDAGRGGLEIDQVVATGGGPGLGCAGGVGFGLGLLDVDFEIFEGRGREEVEVQVGAFVEAELLLVEVEVELQVVVGVEREGTGAEEGLEHFFVALGTQELLQTGIGIAAHPGL